MLKVVQEYYVFLARRHSVEALLGQFQISRKEQVRVPEEALLSESGWGSGFRRKYPHALRLASCVATLGLSSSVYSPHELWGAIVMEINRSSGHGS